jgi:hypothetical protein
MVKDLFRPFEDNLSQHFQVDFQPSLESYDADHFRDVDLFYKDFQPPLSLISNEHHDVAIPEQPKAHSTNRKYFHIGDFYKDSQMKRPRFSFSIPKHVPYLIPPSQGNHKVFFGSLISSKSSRSNYYTNGDEDETSSTYGSPLKKWIDHAYGYTFMQHEQADDFSFH